MNFFLLPQENPTQFCAISNTPLSCFLLSRTKVWRWQRKMTGTWEGFISPLWGMNNLISPLRKLWLFIYANNLGWSSQFLNWSVFWSLFNVLGRWLRDDDGGAGVMVGLDDLADLFQAWWFCDTKSFCVYLTIPKLPYFSLSFTDSVEQSKEITAAYFFKKKIIFDFPVWSCSCKKPH